MCVWKGSLRSGGVGRVTEIVVIVVEVATVYRSMSRSAGGGPEPSRAGKADELLLLCWALRDSYPYQYSARVQGGYRADWSNMKNKGSLPQAGELWRKTIKCPVGLLKI